MRRTDPIPDEEADESTEAPEMGLDKDGEPQDDYPRPDPDARGSEGPQLPLPEESEPEDEADADIIDYKSALEEEEEDWHADVRYFHTEGRKWRPQKPRTDDELVQDLKAYMNHCIEQEQMKKMKSRCSATMSRSPQDTRSTS